MRSASGDEDAAGGAGRDPGPGSASERPGGGAPEADGFARHGGFHEQSGPQKQVYGITTADESHEAEITRRQLQYTATMLFRIVSIIVVVLIPGISWPFKLLLCALATLIPYVAVIRANGGPPQQAAAPTNLLIGPPQRPALEDEDPGLPSGPRIVPGEAWSAEADADSAGLLKAHVEAEPEAESVQTTEPRVSEV